MKIIEHRRHSIRETDGVHLNQEGINLARKVGNDMGTYDLVVTSQNDRAFDTAIAMGYAVNKQLESLNSFGEEVINEVENWSMPFTEIKSYYDKKAHLHKFCWNHQKFLEELLKDVQNGESILIISHGGIVDYPLVHLFPNEDFQKWGQPFSYCEGYRLYFEDGLFTKVELLRT